MSETLRGAARGWRAGQTPAERQLWGCLRAGRLNGLSIRRQQPIGPYIVDFYCSAAKLVIEIDGAIHEQQRDYDWERDNYLAAYGLRILRFTNEQVLNDLGLVLATIRRIATTP